MPVLNSANIWEIRKVEEVGNIHFESENIYWGIEDFVLNDRR